MDARGDEASLERLLADVAAGRVDVAQALARLAPAGARETGVDRGGPTPARAGSDDTGPADATSGILDLGYARLDIGRAARTGDAEVVYGAGKTPEQIVDLVGHLRAAHPDRPALVTRLTDVGLAALTAAFPDAAIDEAAHVAAVGPLPEPAGTVTVVAAGTSDVAVASEAAFVARAFGAGVQRITDVGVAGLHRLLAVRSELDAADCLIVVAGMEGALPSVVGGLTGVPIVAVPTSVGYGASFGGLAALLGMLNSCAPGITVTNIDNGFGAGVFASRVARRAHRAPTPVPPSPAPSSPVAPSSVHSSS